MSTLPHASPNSAASRAGRALLLRHPDRVLFGTDQLRLRRATYETYFRFLETSDEYFPCSPKDPPPNGHRHISALDLPSGVIEKVYAANARRLIT